jgi:hypothetical protein
MDERINIQRIEKMPLAITSQFPYLCTAGQTTQTPPSQYPNLSILPINALHQV